ncbi:heat shock factor protein 2 [Nerophis ophidion]|uniref:heat shock factor protein 2 n=1 Tax=Nerophis ophidion TaxID=159077 RepID=UPI002ADFFCF6|nr:heat shock factor protein 2 [Nerophis ophidion]
MKHNSNVPGFLTKLWTLVEDADTDELICWSQQGNSFLVLDELRFSKEILPKFFKHNNMTSFIRQLNMYGFRKVMHPEQGIVKQERDVPVEFQHTYFKQGQDDLLENIKRKVSSTRPEDNKIRQGDLSKILASVQSVHSKQENIDVRLATLKRENEALWTEISDMRQKYAHQQQLIKKLIHFIVTLVQNNHILNLKRKRPILMNSNGKKPKYFHEIYDDKVCVEQSPVNSVKDDVVICDLTENEAEVTDWSPRPNEPGDVEIVEVDVDPYPVLAVDAEASTTCTEDVKEAEVLEQPRNSMCDSSRPTSSILQLNKPSGMSFEDPVKIMDSILNENSAISQNINLLGKMELMDYLESIEWSMEDFQAMLYGKPLGIDIDALEETVSSKESPTQLSRCRQREDNTDKQVIQYTSSPLLAFLDGCVPPAEVPSTSADSIESELPSELLDGSVESKPAARSSLIRLEPLTEAEASQETLFYLCELSPSRPESDPAELDSM